MSNYYLIDGTYYELDRAELAQIHWLTVRHATPILGGPMSTLDRNIEWHRLFSRNHFGMIWLHEVVGGADLPTTSRVQSLKRRGQSLKRDLRSQRNSLRFFDRFPRWARSVTRLHNEMIQYRQNFYRGGARLARGTYYTREAAFITLQGLAAVSSGGVSAVATTGLRAGIPLVVRQAAVGALTSGIRTTAGNLGRAASGETVTLSDTVGGLADAGIEGLSGPLMGRMWGEILDDLIGSLMQWARRAVANGQLADALVLSVADDQLEDAIRWALGRMLSNYQEAARRILRQSMEANNRRTAASRAADSLKKNRLFRGEVERHLMRAAR